jgi:thiamine biosynthesis lipoprotein
MTFSGNFIVRLLTLNPSPPMGAREVNRRFRVTAWLLVLLLIIVGCKSETESRPLSRFEFNEPHMGTLFSVTLYAPDADTATAAAEAAFRRVAKLDRMMTDYDPKSELMQLCQRPVGEPTRVSPELFEIIGESLRVARETDGAFDITVGPMVRAWRAARKSKVLPTTEEIAELRKAVGSQKLRLDARNQTVTLLVPHMQLDLGGIAKGYAADQALAVMRKMGIKSALVAASGDIAIGDAPPGKTGWKIGIEALDSDTKHLARSVYLHNAGVSTSGGTEQFVEIGGVRYSHIIDPATGLGMTNRIQSTIIGPNATITDGLDTPTAIMGVKRALALVDSQPKLAAILFTHDADGVHEFASRQFKERFGAK